MVIPLPAGKQSRNRDVWRVHRPADIARGKLFAMVEGTVAVRRALPTALPPKASPDPTVEQGA